MNPSKSKTTKPKKKVKCSNCRLVGHTKSGCYKYWQDRNERELKYRNFDDDEVCGRRKGSR